MTFGNYPEVSLDLARSHRSVVRKILKSGLDPREVFDYVRVGAPTSVIGQRLLPMYVNKAKLASCAALVGNDAVKRVESLVFPAFQRLVAEAVLAKSLLPALEQIRTDRNVEVVNVLYAMCEEIAAACLKAGIDEEMLGEAMKDSRGKQRRSS